MSGTEQCGTLTSSYSSTPPFFQITDHNYYFVISCEIILFILLASTMYFVHIVLVQTSTSVYHYRVKMAGIVSTTSTVIPATVLWVTQVPSVKPVSQFVVCHLAAASHVWSYVNPLIRQLSLPYLMICWDAQWPVFEKLRPSNLCFMQHCTEFFIN